jgi:outer membrane immunogenic protein
MDKSRASCRSAFLIAAAVALGSAAPAQADVWQSGESGRWVPGTPMTDSQNVTDWSGIYIGGKLGGAWSDINWTQNFDDFEGGGVPPGTGASFSPSSFTGGVFGGGNLQMGNWIFGLEASFEGMGLNQSAPSPYFPATDTFKTEIDWLIFVEPRIGFTWDRTMVFVKGGWAGGNANLTATGPGNDPTTVETASADDFFDGWTIGGGIEYAWWPSVIVGLEYRHTELNLSTAATCDLCSTVGIAIDSEPSAVNGNANIDTVQLRASYLFKPED